MQNFISVMAQTCQQHAYKNTLREKYSLSFQNTLLLIFKDPHIGHR